MPENETQHNFVLPTDSGNPSQLPLYYIVLASFVAFVAVVGNGMVIFIICTRRRLHVVTNYFVVSLAAADFLVGLFLPTVLIICHYWSGCEITTFNMFFNLFTLVSIASLFVMTVDRYMSIVHPLRYPTHATFRRIFGAIFLSWFLPGLLAFSPLLWMFSSSEEAKDMAKKVHAFIVITTFEVVPTVILPAMYAHIFLTARRHAHQVTVQKTQLAYNSTCEGEGYNKRVVLEIPVKTDRRICNTEQQSKGKRKSMESSNIAVLGSVIGFFVLCWSFDIVISFCNKFELCIISDGLFRVSDVMIFVNSAMNPLVYALLKKDIKRELCSMCCCLNRDQVTEI